MNDPWEYFFEKILLLHWLLKCWILSKFSKKFFFVAGQELKVCWNLFLVCGQLFGSVILSNNHFPQWRINFLLLQCLYLMYCRKCRVVDSIFNNKNLAQKTHRRQPPWPFFDSGSTSPAFPKSMLATQGVDKFPLPPWAADNPPKCKCPLPADLLTSPPGWLITRKSQPQVENTHSLSENFLIFFILNGIFFLLRMV